MKSCLSDFCRSHPYYHNSAYQSKPSFVLPTHKEIPPNPKKMNTNPKLELGYHKSAIKFSSFHTMNHDCSSGSFYIKLGYDNDQNP